MASRRQALVGELGNAMQAYQRSTQAFDDEVGRVLDVNPVDLRCLDWLTEGPLSASRLAEATGLSAAATTSMIDRLERSGFVRRRKHDTDRRQVLVEMTDEGRARTWELYGPLVAAGAPLLATFSVAQLEAMRDHLVAITELTDVQRERLRGGPEGDARTVPTATMDVSVADRRHDLETLLDLLAEAVAANGDKTALSLRLDDGTTTRWTYRELDRRSRAAAWRLRALGLRRGDRLLTWSPSTPELPATYFGAMRAGLILVPLDLRMSSEAVEAIVATSGAVHLILGTGRDAPDPREARLDRFPTTTVEAIAAPPDDTFPPDWGAQLAAWPAPSPSDVFELVFTSGTTGTPKGVMLAHANVVASIETFHRIVPRMEHRIVSLLPLSHLLEQAVGLFYALSVGADILYVRSRNPRVIFDALRDHRVTSMVVVPQVLDLFWNAIDREVSKRGRETAFSRLRGIARHLPMSWRPRLFGSIHSQLGGHFRLFLSAGAFLPPALQQAWEDLGVTVLQGYGATETGTGSSTRLHDHGLGTVGTPPEGVEMRIVATGEIQFRGPTVFSGYWQNPTATAEAFTEDGWYKTGDIGHFDPEGRLILSGRIKDIIVLPNGFNVYPEDIENALRIAGIRDSVVLETQPGRIEAVVLGSAAGGPGGATGDIDPAVVRERLDAAVKAANATLGPNQRIAGWRLWPEEDFPRTHTLKIKRGQVRSWVAADAPLPVA